MSVTSATRPIAVKKLFIYLTNLVALDENGDYYQISSGVTKFNAATKKAIDIYVSGLDLDKKA